ncbi:MAG: precorrin-6y C5,15-methyltransferase (decarboxylating) subunit CbiE [Rhodospirillales bacterium]|nr:precorrin-6y C5,15-methyltransferase (decarboxylating) subunit CbiE [Rhodospirillales bacterium]
MSGPWLTLVGIGEAGVAGLCDSAHTALCEAELVVGGRRQLALARSLIQGETLVWPSPPPDAFPAILERRGRPVAVLASGDPFHYGIGTRLSTLIAPEELRSLPVPSAFSLAASKLAWNLPEVACVSLCGRPLESLAPHLQPDRRLLVLSADETTPGKVAAYLTGRGFGDSQITLLEALGGPDERLRGSRAKNFRIADTHRLNLLAIELSAAPEALVLPLSCGLPDSLFESDGQMTKREIRAVTLSSLVPRAGAAPEALAGLSTPDAVFVGGGGSDPAVLEAAWTALPSGGRLVANAVTIETESLLAASLDSLGGSLTRIGVERSDQIGRFNAYRPSMTVTQWICVKP